MAIGGTRKKKNFADEYENSPFSALSEQYSRVANDVKSRERVDLFAMPAYAVQNPNVYAALESFFVEGSYDKKYYENKPKELLEYKNDMKELFRNDIDAITEYTNMASVNPIVTTGLPMHKLISMRNIFKQGVIQTNVAVEPRFTIKMQHRYLVTPDGKELDLVLDQDKLTDAFNSVNPKREIELTLTNKTVNSADLSSGQRLVEQCNGVLGRDNLNTDLEIIAVQIEADVPDPENDGQTKKEAKWVSKKIQFTPSYGPNNMTSFNQPLDFSPYITDGTTAVDILSGTLINNEMVVTSANGLVKKIKIRAQLDPSNGLIPTCRARWGHDETYVVIPNQNPMNIPISPEEIKDIQAMYGVSQLNMYMSIINDVLGNYKDDTIRTELYASYDNMPAAERKYDWFDFEPRDGYDKDHVQWRHSSFMDVFDSFVTDLLMILNDENVTVTILGRPDIIRKITPTEYSYKAPATIEGVDLEFTRTVATSDRRVYNFISSQKLGRSNDLTVILNPNNSSRIIYRVYDYQFYISNEIRNAQNAVLPGIHAFERFKFLEYQPVQGKFRIFNPSGRNENNEKYTSKLVDLAGLE